ncbi:HAD-like domain-containing protein [Aspergillus floccosus]
MPKAVIFDLLTALLDSWSLWNAAAGSEDAGRRWRGRYLEITFGCGEYRPYEDLVRESAVDTGIGEEAASTLLTNWDHLQPWPEAADVLQSLRRRGYLLGVVTNCSSELGHRAANRCGIQFDAVLTAEEVGFYKPHVATYQGAVAAVGVNLKEALFVAGSNGDVIGAAAAEMDVVWHNRVGLPALPGSAPFVEGNTLREALGALLRYEGVPRSEIPTPAAYINRTKFAANCERMRQRAKAIGAAFRVHIKTHKTVQGTEFELQDTDGRVICSTLKEIEHLEPLLRRRAVRSVLYGVLAPRTAIHRLAALRKKFSTEIILMIDHPAQIAIVEELTTGDSWPIFINVDCGSRREGIELGSDELAALIEQTLQSTRVRLYGIYCHAGHSYATNSLEDAEQQLLHEIACGGAAAQQCLNIQPDLQLTISVGATPTAHAASASVLDKIQTLPKNLKLEIHAGNFAVLDLQQLSTGLAGFEDVSGFIEAEITSIYPGRREVLVNIGSLGLGREPGREAGVWGRAAILSDRTAEQEFYPWNVVRISQEHGLLTPRTGDAVEVARMINAARVGSRVRIIPQHACIAGSMYASYLVVDDDDGECVDEWVRCRGW